MAKKKATFTFDEQESPIYALVDDLMLDPASPYYMLSQGDILRIAVEIGLEVMAQDDVADMPEAEGASKN